MISIILPTYNGERYIREAIDSVLMQTYQDWEMIVIDDHSTDRTNEIVQSYVDHDKRIKLHRNQQNMRLPTSLNIGFSKAKGDYLTWTSDDNVFKPEALQVLVEALTDDPKIGLVFAAMDYIDNEGKLTGHTQAVLSKDELFYKNIVGASFMYTRKVYEMIGDYDTHKFLVEDYDYWIRIARKFDIQYVKKSLYLYRQHGGSLTETRNHDMLEAKVKLLEEELNESDVKPEIKEKIYRELAIASFSLDHFEQMKFYINKMRCTQKNISDLPRKIRVSYRIGKWPTKFIRKIYRTMKKRG